MPENATYTPNTQYLINLNDLLADPDQPRKYLDPAALQELTESIRRHGVLQPIMFRQDVGGLLYVIAGERRCASARSAGLTAIPAIYKENVNYDEISLIENLLRSDLTAVEEAEGFDRLMKKHSYTQDDLSRIVSKSISSVSKTLSLNRLPKEVLDECRKDPAMPKRILIEIAQKKQSRSMLTAYLKYKAGLNPRKKPSAGRAVSEAQAAFEAMDKVETRIENLDIKTLSTGDKQSLVIALENLKQTINAKLQAVTGPSKNLA
jgi:ParB family chromosome partitioning protein